MRCTVSRSAFMKTLIHLAISTWIWRISSFLLCMFKLSLNRGKWSAVLMIVVTMRMSKWFRVGTTTTRGRGGLVVYLGLSEDRRFKRRLHIRLLNVGVCQITYFKYSNINGKGQYREDTSINLRSNEMVRVKFSIWTGSAWVLRPKRFWEEAWAAVAFHWHLLGWDHNCFNMYLISALLQRLINTKAIKII